MIASAGMTKSGCPVRTKLLMTFSLIGVWMAAAEPALGQEACCFSSGQCTLLDAADCTAQGGVPGGVGSTCVTTVCCTSMLSDTLDITDPIYNRVAGSGVNLNCNLNLGLSAIGTAVRYATIPINSHVGGLFSAEIIMDGTTIGDTTMSLYCDPFDPGAPASNLVSFDDDGGEGVLSAFIPSDGIVLNPDDRHWLVVSTYGNGVTGDFTLCLGAGYFVVEDADHDGTLDDEDPCFGDQALGDTDGDGICDDLDGCPNDPNKSEPGVCGCGMPDDDSDGDGVCDGVDLCPGEDDTLDADANGTPDCLDVPPAVPPAEPPAGCCAPGVFPTVGMLVPAVLMWAKLRRRRRPRK